MGLLLIGNNQAENPWLEESLATFGDGIAGGDAIDYRNRDISRCVVSLLGQPMTYWADNGGFDRYIEGAYNPGAACSYRPNAKPAPTASTPRRAPTSRRTRIRSPLRLASPTPTPRCHQCLTCSPRPAPCSTVDAF